jgi:hypothetical protein
MTDDDVLKGWLLAEREAVSAEMAVSALGQGAADPRAAALYAEAREKRKKADELFQEVYSEVGKPSVPPHKAG